MEENEKPTSRNTTPNIIVHAYILTHSGVVVGTRTARSMEILTDLAVIGRQTMDNTILTHQRRPSDQEESVSSAPHSVKKKVSHSTPYPKLAQQLYEKGLEPAPIEPGQKFPKTNNWNSMQLPVKWPSNEHSIGLRKGETATGIDLKNLQHSKFSETALTHFCPCLNMLPAVLFVAFMGRVV